MFAASDVAGSVVSIVPAGLGVNETVAALLAPLVAVPPADPSREGAATKPAAPASENPGKAEATRRAVGRQPLTVMAGVDDRGRVVLRMPATSYRAVPVTRRTADGRDETFYRYEPVVTDRLVRLGSKDVDAYDPDGQPLTWDEVYAGWCSDALKYYWTRLPLTEVAFDRTWFDRRDALGFALGEAGDPRARSVLQRIVARDPDPAKRERAARLLATLDAPASLAPPAY